MRIGSYYITRSYKTSLMPTRHFTARLQKWGRRLLKNCMKDMHFSYCRAYPGSHHYTDWLLLAFFTRGRYEFGPQLLQMSEIRPHPAKAHHRPAANHQSLIVHHLGKRYTGSLPKATGQRNTYLLQWITSQDG